MLDDQGFWMVWVSGVEDPTGLGFGSRRPNPPKKKLELNVAGDNEGSWGCVYLQCECYTKTFYKPSVFVFSMPISNY